MTFEQFRDKILRWSAVLPQAAKKALTEAAETVRREVQKEHLTGPTSPRDGDPAHASLAVRTGRLRRSIAIDVQVNPGVVSATVGTNVFYGRYHEEGRDYTRTHTGVHGLRLMAATGSDIGNVHLPARPFLRPSLNAKHAEIFEKLRVRLFESYDKGAA